MSISGKASMALAAMGAPQYLAMYSNVSVAASDN